MDWIKRHIAQFVLGYLAAQLARSPDARKALALYRTGFASALGIAQALAADTKTTADDRTVAVIDRLITGLRGQPLKQVIHETIGPWSWAGLTVEGMIDDLAARVVGERKG